MRMVYAAPLLRLEHVGSSSAAEPFSAVVPPVPFSSSPSRSYVIRLSILTIIAPVGLLVYRIFCALSLAAKDLLSIAQFFVELLFFSGCFVAICWLAKGRPPVAEFLDTQPITRVVNRLVGVARRPTLNADGLLGPPIGGQPVARRPIRGVADFFRSSAPLDDLLATFDSTRHLTQPMRFGRGATQSNALDAPMETLSPKEDFSEKSDVLQATAPVDLEAGLAVPEKSIG